MSEYCFHGFCVFTTIAQTIINKYNRATKSKLDSRQYFEDLSTVPTAEEMDLLETEIAEAEEMRSRQENNMDVMAPRIPRGQFIHLLDLSNSLLHSTNLGWHATQVV